MRPLTRAILYFFTGNAIATHRLCGKIGLLRKVMAKCVVEGCGATRRNGISLHSFPKVPDLRTKWLNFIGKSEVAKSARICELHFDEKQFERSPALLKAVGQTSCLVRLRKESVPSLVSSVSEAKRKVDSQTVAHDSAPEVKKRKSLEVEYVARKTGNDEAVSEHGCQSSQDVAAQAEEDDTDRLCEPDIPVYDTSPVDIQSLMTLAGTSNGPVDEISSGVSTCKSKKKTEMFSVQCQVPYNLVKRKHAAVQENPKMCTREVQTDVVLSVPEADRRDMDSTLHSSMYSYKSKEDPEWLPLDDSTLSEQSFQQEHVNEAKERKFIVFETELDKLFRLCRKCNRELIMEKYVSGTFVKVTTTCSTCVENEEWSSQPMSGSMAFGNLILGAAILFSGLSPGKALKMMAFAGIQTFCERAFSVYQRIYYVPSVMSVWTSHQARLADTISKAGRTVKLGGDARCDSPGHTAKYGSYSVMDLETNKILDCQLVQSNEVKNSYWMELEGLKRCLRYMSDVGIRVSHLVTDRHVQVKKYMREQPTIRHWFDVWHVAKGIFKKLQAVGKKKGCEKVQQWARSISNHLYWCAASSDGDEQLLTDKWLSILNHIPNIHTGHGERFPECLHDILEDRLWMKKGYRPYQETSKIVASKHLLKDIGKLSPAEQTSSLEAFHKVVCQFAHKFVHYDHPQMEARLCIASLHFNENANRAQATKKDGSLQFSVSYPRGRDTGVAKEVKVEMTYDYVDELMAEVLFCRETAETHSVALERRLQDETSWPSAGDGSRVCPVPLAQSTPYKQSKTELIQNRISRFNH